MNAAKVIDLNLPVFLTRETLRAFLWARYSENVWVWSYSRQTQQWTILNSLGYFSDARLHRVVVCAYRSRRVPRGLKIAGFGEVLNEP